MRAGGLGLQAGKVLGASQQRRTCTIFFLFLFLLPLSGAPYYVRPNSVKIKSRYFADFCGLKHAPCMSNLLGIFVLCHYIIELYTPKIQNGENDVIFFLNTQFNYRAHAGGTLVV